MVRTIEEQIERTIAAQDRAAKAMAWLKIATSAMEASTDERCRLIAEVIQNDFAPHAKGCNGIHLGRDCAGRSAVERLEQRRAIDLCMCEHKQASHDRGGACLQLLDDQRSRCSCLKFVAHPQPGRAGEDEEC